MKDFITGIFISDATLQACIENPRLLKLLQAFRWGYVSLNYRELAKDFGYKTRSGIWKAVKKLIDLNAISVHPQTIFGDKCTTFKTKGIYLDL